MCYVTHDFNHPNDEIQETVRVGCLGDKGLEEELGRCGADQGTAAFLQKSF